MNLHYTRIVKGQPILPLISQESKYILGLIHISIFSNCFSLFFKIFGQENPNSSISIQLLASRCSKSSKDIQSAVNIFINSVALRISFTFWCSFRFCTSDKHLLLSLLHHCSESFHFTNSRFQNLKIIPSSFLLQDSISLRHCACSLCFSEVNSPIVLTFVPWSSLPSNDIFSLGRYLAILVLEV